REITELWRQADSGKAFAASLTQRGYVLCRGDRRDFCVIDQAGEAHSLARRIEGAKAADIRARMADIDREGLPTGAGARPLPMEAAPARELVASPPAEPARETVEPVEVAKQKTALDSFASEVNEVMHTQDGNPHFGDGLSWIERAVAVFE